MHRVEGNLAVTCSPYALGRKRAAEEDRKDGEEDKWPDELFVNLLVDCIDWVFLQEIPRGLLDKSGPVFGLRVHILAKLGQMLLNCVLRTLSQEVKSHIGGGPPLESFRDISLRRLRSCSGFFGEKILVCLSQSLSLDVNLTLVESVAVSLSFRQIVFVFMFFVVMVVFSFRSLG